MREEQKHNRPYSVVKTTDVSSADHDQLFQQIHEAVSSSDHDTVIRLSIALEESPAGKPKPNERAGAFRVRALAHARRGERLESAKCIALAQEIAEQEGLDFELARVYSAKATMKAADGDLAGSLELHLKSYELKRKLNQPASFSHTLHEIGSLYASMQKPEKAVEALQECIAIRTTLRDEWGVATALHSIGLAYYYSEMHEKALEFTLQALALKEKFPERENSIAMTRHSLATIYYYLKEYEQAKHHLHQAILVKEQHSDLRSLLLSYTLDACIERELGQLESALALGFKALEFCQRTESTGGMLDVMITIADCYEALGDYKAALDYYRQSQKLKDEDTVKANGRRFEEISAELQLAQARHKVEVEQLRSAQLHQRVQAANRELTALALHVAQRNEMLTKLRKQIVDTRASSKVDDTEILNSVERQLQSALRNDNAWQSFDEQFDSIHGDFVRELLDRHPSLSPLELRLSALLLLHLSSKEIAMTMSISTKSVEVYRTRLRKKMRLSPEVNLVTYLITLKKKEV